MMYGKMLARAIDNHQVDVWLVRLPDDGTIPADTLMCLSPDESQRADRFLFPRDRAKYTVAHSSLRQILAEYTGQDPASLSFGTAQKGKPYLAEHPDTRFNLSHSGCWAMVAVARAREVGVDIECIRGERSTREIAERFFASNEVAALMSFPEPHRLGAFFACWSRKEAYMKARGEGLGIPLDSFEVSLGENAELRKAEDRERWTLCSLQAPGGYAAALVAEGSGWRVRQLDWPCRPEI